MFRLAIASTSASLSLQLSRPVSIVWIDNRYSRVSSCPMSIHICSVQVARVQKSVAIGQPARTGIPCWSPTDLKERNSSLTVTYRRLSSEVLGLRGNKTRTRNSHFPCSCFDLPANSLVSQGYMGRTNSNSLSTGCYGMQKSF